MNMFLVLMLVGGSLNAAQAITGYRGHHRWSNVFGGFAMITWITLFLIGLVE